MKYSIPILYRHGSGSIVVVSSANGLVGIPGIAPYTSSKHAVIGLMKSTALECADRGIRVNAVAPYVDTVAMKELSDGVREWMREHQMKRMASVREVAETVVCLLSDKSVFTTGAVYSVDGGYVAQW